MASKDNEELRHMCYWKEIKPELSEIMDSQKEFSIVFHNIHDFNGLIDFLERIPSKNTVLYVSLTKTYDSIKEQMKKMNQTFFTVDCISKSLIENPKAEGCIFKSVPSTALEMAYFIKDGCEMSSPDYVVVDSISQVLDLSSYSASDYRTLSSFIQTMKTINLCNGYKFIFLCKEDPTNIADFLRKFFDPIIRMEVSKENGQWIN